MIFRLNLQMKSGKNRVLITRQGRRYAPKEFTVWRDACLKQLDSQRYDARKTHTLPLHGPIRLRCEYTPGDNRVRDVDGMLGALMHVIVKAGLLEDDWQVYDVEWKRNPVNKEKPGLIFLMEVL